MASVFVPGVFVVACALALSGCVGGTTYGTGVSQEAQTISDLGNILKLRKDREAINYAERPDLVIPKDKTSLPQPVNAQETASNPDWPETPEERIARVREDAGEVNARTGDYTLHDITVQLQRDKEGRQNDLDRASTTASADGKGGNGAPKPVCAGEDGAVEGLDCVRVKQRTYLTDPPTAYRIPAESAPHGEKAFSEEEIQRRKQAELDARNQRNELTKKSAVTY